MHEAEYKDLQVPPEPAHRFEVSLESNAFSEEKYKLFEQYQRIVHKEGPFDISRKGFRRFLCESPIPYSKGSAKDGTQLLGSYHQCYRLNGKLIALGVLDLLPHAVSSVYLIYDVEYEKYSFGKLSALREAALATEGGYDYYYMGFYIHSCKKMRYKNDYKPQYILDPDTNKWDQLDDDHKARLDREGFVSLSRDLTSEKIRNGSRSTVPEDGFSEAESSRGGAGLDKPTDVQDSGRSLLDAGLPGIMSQRELQDNADLDSMMVRFGPEAEAQFAPAQVS